MNEFIIIKAIPFSGSDEHVCLRWDSTFTANSFVFEHYETYEQAKAACKSSGNYPVKKLDYEPIMTFEKWNKIQADYMEMGDD